MNNKIEGKKNRKDKRDMVIKIGREMSHKI
jgi:hypothetical protein